MGITLRWEPNDHQFLELTHKLRQENVDRWLLEDEAYSGIPTDTLIRRIEVDRIVCELAKQEERRDK